MNTTTFRSNLVNPPKATQAALESTTPSINFLGEVSIAVMIFSLVATNGTPMWWNSALPCLGLSLVLIVLRGPRVVWFSAFSKDIKFMTISIVVYSLFNLLSMLANFNDITGFEFVTRTFIPVLIYFSLTKVPLKVNQLRFVFIVFAIGCLYVCTKGAIAFYKVWGIPDPHTLIWARYDRFKMAEYNNQTFGNVTHMSLYIVMTLSVSFLGGIYLFKKGFWRYLLLFTGFMSLVNIVICSSRVSIFVTTGMCFICLLSIKSGKKIFHSFVVFMVFMYLSYTFLSQSIGIETLINRYVPMADGTMDESTLSRIDSISHGWELLQEYPFFGIGPGVSIYYHEHAMPHQSFVHVASEIGIFGGIVFIILNFYTIFQTLLSAVRSKYSYYQKMRFIILLSPFAWFVHGIVGGFNFHMSLALLWVGIAHAMLGLSSFVLVDEPKE